MNFHLPSKLFATLMLAGLLFGCADGEGLFSLTIPSADIPPEETVFLEEDSSESLVTEPVETQEQFNIREETTYQKTIRSIIEQLEQRKKTAPQEDSTTSQGTVIWNVDTHRTTNESGLEGYIILSEEQNTLSEERNSSIDTETITEAFALTANRTDRTELTDQDVQSDDIVTKVIAKPSQGIRAAVLAPLAGRAASIGREMQYGAELAIFTLDNSKIDLTFHDTSQGINRALDAAMVQQPDIIIGPLFAEDTIRAKQVAQRENIPVLSFSNNSAVAGQGAWLLGQTPEQEIETALRYALGRVRPIQEAARQRLSVGVIAQHSPYGQRISQRAVNLLSGRNDATYEVLVLKDDVLAEEEALRANIENLTKWIPPKDGDEAEPPRPPQFDIVLLAGDVAFGLRVAPVLSWYDLDPGKVQYLGTSLWMTPAILQEPSLEGAWFASQPASSAEEFQSLWSAANEGRASKYAMMAFDAVALVSTLDSQHRDGLGGALTNSAGFSGFSGAFKLTPDGSNVRQLEIRQIKSGGFDVIAPAKTTF